MSKVFQYKVNYVDWKGRPALMFVFASSLMEARAQAMVGQGVFKLVNVEEVK
ncbi:hypothetical protein NGG61_13255 [Enterococcus casseliflavus]|uniref:hypothetical protein n=1 Tax=Enterococcus casseliflavus TaxID=37734 RepID=UPI002DB62775|nr:hypothetical protein [Enterococcus casseliflavus]MEB8400889.1 hypothetical protein [Enterococcus casseliflavus]